MNVPRQLRAAYSAAILTLALVPLPNGALDFGPNTRFEIGLPANLVEIALRLIVMIGRHANRYAAYFFF